MTSRLALLAAAATGVQVGAAMVATRFVAGLVGPFSLALLRYAIGLLCLLPALASMRPLPRFSSRDLLPIMLLGAVQFGVLIALLNIGLARVPAGQGATIFAVFPLLTLLLAAALGREALTPVRLGGVLLTMCGVGVALNGGSFPGPVADPLGSLAILAAAGCGAACSVFYGPFLRRYPTLPVSALAMLASVAVLAVPAFAFERLGTTVTTLGTEGWAAVSFIGVGSGVGYVCWLWALRHAAPTQVTVFLSLSPITAVLLGSLLLGEPLSPAMLPALACLAAGFWLTSR